jgi:FlaA1/EpsC-like NDP-sugar epimerase
MTSEATQLVLQAGSMGQGGEIFLLDMGEPVQIVRLAEELIRLSGLRPYEDINIAFTGLRPGEKLSEALLLAGEGIQPTSHEKISVARATHCDLNTLNLKLEKLNQAAKELDVDSVVAMLKEIVPEYRAQGMWGQPRESQGEQELINSQLFEIDRSGVINKKGESI